MDLGLYVRPAPASIPKLGVAAGFDVYIRYCSSKQRKMITGGVGTPCRDGIDYRL